MRWYPSKVDWWLVPLLGLLPLSAIAIWVQAAISGSRADVIVAVATSAFVGFLVFGLAYPVRYGMGDAYLVVRFGIFRTRIALADISKVVPTRNPLSSPALSLDRLSITFGPGLFGTVLISPADRERFVNELAHKTGLRREGDRLFRA